MHCMQSKTNLCTLNRNTTPELTAYNAYKKTIWLRSRAENTKMYAYGNAYRLHTKCIQAYKRVKKEEFLFYLLFILPVLFYCSRFQAIFLTVRRFGHVRTSSDLTACPSRSRAVRNVRIMAYHPPKKLYALYAVKNEPMHAIREHNSEKDCIQCIQEESLAQE